MTRLMAIAATPLTYGRDVSIARFSVASYQCMVASGALTSEDKVELLENYVVAVANCTLKAGRKPPSPIFIVRASASVVEARALSLSAAFLAASI